MKTFSYTLLILLIIGLITYFIMAANGYTFNDIVNKPKTIDLKVDCTDLNNLVFVSELNLSVSNLSGRTHNDVTVRVSAFDKHDNLVKEKTVTFDRTLEPNSTLTRAVTLPAGTKHCDCVIENSSPN